jgi:lactoylglutathione lyase
MIALAPLARLGTEEGIVAWSPSYPRGRTVGTEFGREGMSKQIPIVTWDHIVVRVSDVERSLDFYRSHLGFETEVDVTIGGAGLEKILGAIAADPEKVKNIGARLVIGRVGGQRVELIEYRGLEGAPISDIGIGAFTLEVSDIDEAFSAVEEGGISYDTEPVEIEGNRQFFIRDPDGIRIELTQFPKKPGTES